MDTDGQETASGVADLTAEQLQHLRGKLLEMQAELQLRLLRTQAMVREAEPQIEPLEVAEQTREQDDALTFSQHDRALLGEVERALRKLEDGAYGISEASGEPIPFARLRAIPWARTDADEFE